MLLDENLLLELHSVAHLHEFVGVAGITVFAGKFAATVRVDCPGEGHARAGAAIEQGANGQGEVFDLVSLANGFSLSCEAGDADQFGFGVRKKGKRSHEYIRFLFAIESVAVIDTGVKLAVVGQFES